MIPNIVPENLKDHQHRMCESPFTELDILSRDPASLTLLPSALCDRKLTVRHHLTCTRFKLKVFDIM
jgi:hypothetical protein